MEKQRDVLQMPDWEEGVQIYGQVLPLKYICIKSRETMSIYIIVKKTNKR
jgi:hypothetical protein